MQSKLGCKALEAEGWDPVSNPQLTGDLEQTTKTFLNFSLWQCCPLPSSPIYLPRLPRGANEEIYVKVVGKL
jgi:hypothetical protein